MNGPACKCCDDRSSRAEMASRHGDPAKFEAACINALDIITPTECVAGVLRYARAFERLTNGELRA